MVNYWKTAPRVDYTVTLQLSDIYMVSTNGRFVTLRAIK